jgi:hypothetical protein
LDLAQTAISEDAGSFQEIKAEQQACSAGRSEARRTKGDNRMNEKPLKRLCLTIAFALVMLASAGFLAAQQKLSTTIYLDYQQFLNSNGAIAAAQKGKLNSFAFRRAYFRYENKINDNLSFRLTFDADTVKAVNASASPDDKFRPFVKHLYFQYANLIPKSVIKVGMADTLTFGIEESKWGYRSVAKTLLDGYADVTGKSIDATSSDLGAFLLGTISKELRYGVSIVTGAGYGHPENDKYKKFAGQIQLLPAAGLTLVGYVDYEKQDPTHNATTYKGDAFFEMVKNLVLGFSYFTYDNKANVDTVLGQFNRMGWTAFGRYTFTTDKFAAFARYDHYDPNSKAADDELGLVIAGLDWAPWTTNVRIQPNIWFYDYKDPAKKNDVYFALTFFMSF